MPESEERVSQLVVWLDGRVEIVQAGAPELKFNARVVLPEAENETAAGVTDMEELLAGFP